MTPDINKLLERLRTYYGDDLACRMLLMDARHALEAMAGEVERLKSQRDEYLQFWKNNAEACEAAEAERDRLKAALEETLRTMPKGSRVHVRLTKALGGDA